MGSIPGSGRSPGEGKGYTLRYSGMENSMNCIVRGVAKSQTWLSDFHSLTHSCSLRLGKQSYLPEFTQLGDRARVQTPAPLTPDFVTRKRDIRSNLECSLSHHPTSSPSRPLGRTADFALSSGPAGSREGREPWELSRCDPPRKHQAFYILSYSSFFFFWQHWEACGILVPWIGIKPLGPWQWNCRVLTTGQPGNSLFHLLEWSSVHIL